MRTRLNINEKGKFNKKKYHTCMRVLDYIGIPWRDPEHWYMDMKGDVIKGQTTIFDFIGEKYEDEDYELE